MNRGNFCSQALNEGTLAGSASLKASWKNPRIAEKSFSMSDCQALEF